MPEIANISSLLIQAQPQRLDGLADEVEALAGVEVQASDPAGKMVVTVETDDDGSLMQTIDAIGRLDGVVNVLLVYHHSEQPNAENRGQTNETDA